MAPSHIASIAHAKLRAAPHGAEDYPWRDVVSTTALQHDLQICQVLVGKCQIIVQSLRADESLGRENTDNQELRSVPFEFASNRLGISVAETGKNRGIVTTMKVKYLKGRQCPQCRAKVVIMLLQYSSTMSSISGVCRKCDHSMKWLLLGGKTAGRSNHFPRAAAANQKLTNDQAVTTR